MADNTLISKIKANDTTYTIRDAATYEALQDLKNQGGANVGRKTTQGGEVFNDYINNIASNNSHAEGYSTSASGDYSHTEGSSTRAIGDNSHAEGEHTCAVGGDQHVQGKYNVPDNSKAFIIGGGNADERKNICMVDWNGNLYLTGKIYILDSKTGEYKPLTTEAIGLANISGDVGISVNGVTNSIIGMAEEETDE